MREKKVKSNKVKAMNTKEMVSCLDVMYNIKRENEQEITQADGYMKKLTEMMKEECLNEVFYSPTELIINAISLYGKCEGKIVSSVDRKVCNVISKMGYI